ncbi:MAG: hypothetical protein WC273_04065 [Dehalococcoidia bacterium]
MDHVDAVLREELGPAEKLLWTGQPRQGFHVRIEDAFLIPISIVWFGFALFWESEVLLTGAPFFFKLWGIPFLALGLYMTVGRFLVDAYQRSHTAYGVTSERVLIASDWFGRRVKSLALDTLTDVTLAQAVRGGGTISFGLLSAPTPWNWGWGMWGTRSGSRFELASDARPAYEAIMSARRTLTGRG